MTTLSWRNILIGLMGLAMLLVGVLASAPPAAAAEKQELQVYAASVMTEAFTELKRVFEKKHPETNVLLNFGATSMLRTQVENGATPDIFESADYTNINTLWRKGYIPGKYQPMAHNRLVVITPAENRAHINSLEDLTRPELILVSCAAEVPVGAYTLQVLDKLNKSGKFGSNYKKKVMDNFRSLEPNVKGIVAKVMLGDADAAFCYASDINENIMKKVKVIPIPEQYNVLASHYIGLVKGCRNPEAGKQFIALTLSPTGQAIFARNGMITLKAAKAKSKD